MTFTQAGSYQDLSDLPDRLTAPMSRAFPCAKCGQTPVLWFARDGSAQPHEVMCRCARSVRGVSYSVERAVRYWNEAQR